MQTWQAIALTLGIFALSLFLPPLFVVAVIFGTALWAAVDSGKLAFSNYKSGISYRPFGIFCVMLLLWIVAFPWYLAVRGKIVRGEATKK